MVQSVNLFMQISAFQSLPSQMLEKLSETATRIEYPRKTTLYQQQEPLTGLYIVVSGYVKLYRQSGDRIQILAILREDDFFGTECLSKDVLSSSSATTMTSSTLIYIPAQALLDVLEANPRFRSVMLRMVTDRLRQFAQLVHNLAFRDVTARLAMLLVTRAETDGIMTVQGIRIPRLMTQSELATMIGTGREVVQRTFKKMEREGLIQVSRKEILIFDFDHLQIMAEEEKR